MVPQRSTHNQGSIMKYLTKLLSCLFIVLMVTGTELSAQDADDLYKNGNFQAAALAFIKAAENDPSNYKNAAMSYTALQQWDNAISMYERYRDNYSGADKNKVNQIIEILRAPEQETFVENVGEPLNSRFDENMPRITADGNRIYFYASELPGGYGGEDVWYSDKEGSGNWKAPVNIGSGINTESHESIMSISGDESVAIVFGNYDGSYGNGDFFFSSKQDDLWTTPCNLGGDINTGNWESMASLSPDGKTLIFVAYEDRLTWDETDGNREIFITHLRNGSWTDPKPISPVINTSGSENWPFLNSDGRTLFFSSDGHPGLGGADLFMSKRIGDGWDRWTTPVNLGKSINSVANDQNLTIPASGSVAYFTRNTIEGQDGFGGNDIYRMILPPEYRPDPVVSVYGEIADQNDEKIRATLFWSDYDTGEELGYSTSNPELGDYYITLPFGRRYLITANQRGYLFKTEVLDLREQEEVTATFSEKIGAEKFRMQNALNRIATNHEEYELLLESETSNLQTDFDKLAELSANMNRAQADLNESVRRAQKSWLEGNSGYLEVRKDIQLTEASEGARLVLRNIYFDTGSADLRSDSQQELDRLFDIMNRSRLVVEIGGHTDNTGSAQLNMNLSQARAESVVQYIVDKGIHTDRISAKGYGQTEPIAENETEEGRQENRRVEVKIVSSNFNQEGTGTVVEDVEERGSENLYELYIAAARAGGLLEGDACYGESQQYISGRDSREPVVRQRRDRISSSSRFIDSSGNDVSAFGTSGVAFLSHSGNGANGFSRNSGRGLALHGSMGTGETELYGYFLGGTYGGGLNWIRYNDLSKLISLPVSVDYGVGGYFIWNKSEFPVATGGTGDDYLVSWGAPLQVRLRYNMEVSGIKISPYASYNYNSLQHVDVNPDPEMNSSGQVIRRSTVVSPSWMEIGARANWSFINARAGYQSSEGATGLMISVGMGGI